MNTEIAGEVITQRSQVTPEWLSAVLSPSGALREGKVIAIDIEGGKGNWSENTRIKPSYAPGSTGSLPSSLFLKMVDAGSSSSNYFFDDSEVAYYTKDYIGLADAPLIRCYSAKFSAEKRCYHILLDDLSATHVDATQKPPTLEHGLALAEGLATMHAHWWGARRIAKAGEVMPSPAEIQQYIAMAQPGIGPILAHFRSQLKPEWPDMIHEIFDKHPPLLIARSKNPNGFTLIHGDVKKPNIMVPIQGERPIYIIDRQPFSWSLTTWLGVYDMALAMVLDWESEIRRRLEIKVLHQYQDWLFNKGIAGYSWDELYYDYRLCQVMGVYTATIYCREGINQPLLPVWLSFLQRTLKAIDDLKIYNLWR